MTIVKEKMAFNDLKEMSKKMFDNQYTFSDKFYQKYFLAFNYVARIEY